MRPKLAILCPMFKDCPVEFVQSLIHCLPRLSANFEPYFISSIGGYIPENRNMIIEKYLSAKKEIGEFDYILWLDSDMVFTDRDILYLCEKMDKFELDMVTALYFAHRKGEKIPLAMIEKEGNYAPIPKALLKNESGIVNIDSAGLGFCLMKPKVLDKMVEDKGNHRIFAFHENVNGLGEDNLFFKTAKEKGFNLFLCYSVIVGHVKQITLGKEL